MPPRFDVPSITAWVACRAWHFFLATKVALTMVAAFGGRGYTIV